MRKGTVLTLATLGLALTAALAWGFSAGGPEESSGPPGTPPTAGPDETPGSQPPPEPTGEPAEPQDPPRPPPEPVRFLAWGDAGHGSPEQHRVGQTAARVCAEVGCDFVLQLGDVIYPKGVSGPHDPQWEEKFERPYANLTIPMYAALGNHDVAMGKVGDAERDNGDFMVRYAFREDRSSDKWRMPSRYYEFREGDVQVIVLDLTALDREGDDLAAEQAQIDWLRDAWDEDARWRVVTSHYPYLSNGAHGNAGRYDGVEGRGAAIARFLEEHVCGKADLYLAGHDHDMEWLKASPKCEGTELVVSGAASEPKPLRKDAAEPAWFSDGASTGFFWFEVRGDWLKGRAYDGDGETLFERAVQKP